MQLTLMKTGKKHNWVRGVRRDVSERRLALSAGQSLTIAFEPAPAKEARRARAPSAGPA